MKFERIPGFSTFKKTLCQSSVKRSMYFDPNAKHQTDDEALEGLLSHISKRKNCLRQWFTNISIAALWCTWIVIILQLIIMFRMKIELDNRIPAHSSIGLRNAKDKTYPAHVPTRFFNENETLNDKSWEAIEAGHGLVAVTPEWALAQGLPPTLVHPHDPGLRIYIIEAYHSIHCLQTIRRHYLNLRRGEIPDRPLEHDLHCFESLRQSVMCQANEDLLWTSGHNDAGVNQTRQCRDWDALRDWATERTSCYHDYTAPPGETRWGKCDHGEDGLPYQSILS